MDYICSICGKKHTNLDQYLNCVNACAKTQREKEQQEKRKHLAARREERRKEIHECYNRLQSLLTEEYEDVGFGSSVLGDIRFPKIFI